MYNHLQYELSREHQNQLLHKAEQQRLANQVNGNKQASQSLSQAVKELRRHMHNLNQRWQEARERNIPVELQRKSY
jgi:phage shock protein A